MPNAKPFRLGIKMGSAPQWETRNPALHGICYCSSRDGGAAVPLEPVFTIERAVASGESSGTKYLIAPIGPV